ncbi:MAG: polyribonucleotide nucleotidyltransferase [SAR324 cluster bacterium]|uniref:Polyribonucleotide nucleotidyltransferase n=1 Tax=SAR324 cluster bacterium TaxID=2024889 RepID=A0A2A4T6T8_9DELT|nr:MAG: polyribonucleotide nucleotidyltransferase [SAR324 cluster bacterium]
MKKIQIDYFGKTLVLETNRIAKQANGSVYITYGDTSVLVAATAQKENTSLGFFPLTCAYQVRAYSQGKILGGFVKRERMPSEMEILASRAMDRPLRPLFDENFSAETQVIATVVSYDNTSNPQAAALLAASTALLISDIPYETAIAGVTVGRVNGEFMVNPSPAQLEESDLDLYLVAKEDAIVMVEAGAQKISEEVMLEALAFGHEAIKPLLKLQEEFRKLVGVKKRKVEKPVVNKEVGKAVSKFADRKLKKALTTADKKERSLALDKIKADTVEALVTEESGFEASEVKGALSDLKKKIIRENILKKGPRIDGRSNTEIRSISSELGLLPKAHGSALFTRGETQALVVATLGTKDDEQMVDDPSGLHFKRFYLHYNFPAYCVGEVRRLAAPGRREIGHGNLAERGLKPVMPSKEKFPYTIRIVSEITESNGSSSMASVCGGSLAMMEAGVPLSEAVAGVAMGMVSDKKNNVILSDILGDEDHVGDMDFKVIGTAQGITALQMDIKIDGLSMDLLKEALLQAKEGRLHILQEMAKSIESSRENIAGNAPRFIQYKISPNKIRDLIGPGGKIIKGIQAESKAKVEVDDAGVVNISSANQESAEKALALVREMTQEVEVGTIYDGKVVKVVDFGAFVEVLPNTQGLVHVSEIAKERVENVEDVLNEGQMIKVKAIGFDKRGKLKLSIKATL